MKRVLLVFLIVTVGVTVVYLITPAGEKKPLPVINPIDVDTSMVDPELLRLGYGHTIGEFSFHDQNGHAITRNDVDGKVFVAEYFFTTCQSICPIMNHEMKRVQKAFRNSDNVAILSFTVDPQTDTVAQLKRYASQLHADSRQWHFLTGEKEQLYALARKSFFVLKPAETANQGDAGSDFIHTNNFVLVDQQLRIRGYYDGTSPKEVNQLIRDISRLLDEEK
jgi:protein SCO1/2